MGASGKRKDPRTRARVKNVGGGGGKGGEETADEMIEISLRKMIGLTQLLLYEWVPFRLTRLAAQICYPLLLS